MRSLSRIAEEVKAFWGDQPLDLWAASTLLSASGTWLLDCPPDRLGHAVKIATRAALSFMAASGIDPKFKLGKPHPALTYGDPDAVPPGLQARIAYLHACSKVAGGVFQSFHAPRGEDNLTAPLLAVFDALSQLISIELPHTNLLVFANRWND